MKDPATDEEIDEFRKKFCQLNYLDRYRVAYGDSPGDLLDLAVCKFAEAEDEDEAKDLMDAVDEALANPSKL